MAPLPKYNCIQVFCLSLISPMPRTYFCICPQMARVGFFPHFFPTTLCPNVGNRTHSRLVPPWVTFWGRSTIWATWPQLIVSKLIYPFGSFLGYFNIDSISSSDAGKVKVNQPQQEQPENISHQKFRTTAIGLTTIYLVSDIQSFLGCQKKWWISPRHFWK